MIGETERAPRNGANQFEDNSVIGIFGRRNDLFFQATRSFILHQMREPEGRSPGSSLMPVLRHGAITSLGDCCLPSYL
jgi:hypothetical protein